MRSSKLFLGTVGALSIFIFMAGATSSMEMKQKKAEMLYEEAILKKDGEGDLTAAIKLFQQILKDFPQNRRIAGQAQLQIGLCFERFGEKEAVIAYRAVIAQYGDQASLVKLARERLSVLSKPTASNSIKGEGIILRELDMPWGYPSPDGRYVIYMGSGGNLVQFDTTSGEEKPLTDFKGCKTCWVDSMTWTPDGKQIAYIWHDSNEVCNLCLINRDGSGNRIVYGNPQKLIIDVAGWMPSGKEIVVLTETKDRKHALGIITVEDGSLKDVQDIEETPFSASLSWDGLHVAYDYRTDKNGFDINVFSFDRGETSSIINHPGNDHVLGWALKGSHLLFASSKTGENGIWIQEIKTGKPLGESRLIHPVNGYIETCGFTGDGTFIFGESQVGTDVFIAQLDLETGDVIKSPERIEKYFFGQTSTPIWSPDGEKIAYLFKTDKRSNDYNILRIRDFKTGQERESLLSFKTSVYMQLPRWSPDGSSIFTRGFQNSKPVLIRIDVKTGESELISEEKSFAAWSASGKTIFIGGRTKTRNFTEMQQWIIRKDIESGAEREIFRGKVGQMLTWIQFSPDEEWLEFSILDYTDKTEVISHGFYAIPARGGELRPLAVTSDPTESTWMFFWGPPNRGFLYTTRSNDGEGEAILWYRPSMEPGQPIKIDSAISVHRDLSFHPDGKTVAFSSSSNSQSKVWALENYLPKDENKK